MYTYIHTYERTYLYLRSFSLFFLGDRRFLFDGDGEGREEVEEAGGEGSLKERECSL
jgi:hypothetical protein